ncbi:MAG TPA: hypothetical protein DDZ36_08920, partial [Deltaproteobacteria bacterium]|nr:hypothetical protein [Deltaproteobacteria bacterium]
LKLLFETGCLSLLKDSAPLKTLFPGYSLNSLLPQPGIYLPGFGLYCKIKSNLYSANFQPLLKLL